MTREEASAVVEMMMNNWTRPEWTEGQVETYVNALGTYDAEIAVKALARAHEQIHFRPTFAEFVSFYRSTQAAHVREQRDALVRERLAAQPQRPVPPSGSRTMPPWVKEWFAARYAYHRFDRPQDMRRFAQQGDWGDPDQKLMPPNEWASEAAALSDTDVKKGLANGGQRTTTRRQTQPARLGSESGVAAANGNRDAA